MVPGVDDLDDESATELMEKLKIVVAVLEQGGCFSGINRKVQIKPTKWSLPVGP